MRRPELIAHRGYTLQYPENTLVAFESAIDAGAQFIECDVQLSADSVPVLFHDRNLLRICNQAGSIHDYTWQELHQFRAYDPERFNKTYSHVPIASLESFTSILQENQNVTAFVELKRISLEHFGTGFVLEQIFPHLKGLEDRIILISFDCSSLIKAREAGWQKVGAVIDHWVDRTKTDIQQLKPQYLFCNVKGLPSQGNIHFPGAKTAVFEVADITLALELAKRGVDMIETFAIGEMMQNLQKVPMK